MLGLELEFISSVEKYPPFKALLKNARGRKKKSRKIMEREREGRRRARHFRKRLTKELLENPLFASLNERQKRDGEINSNSSL